MVVARPQPLLASCQVVYFAFELVAARGTPKSPISTDTERGKCMKTYLATVFAGAAFVAFTGVAIAHHSFAMFDQEHPQEVTGVVKEFKYTSPHSFIILDIKDKEGNVEAWNLEGGSPSALARDGWNARSLKSGDQV